MGLACGPVRAPVAGKRVGTGGGRGLDWLYAAQAAV